MKRSKVGGLAVLMALALAVSFGAISASGEETPDAVIGLDNSELEPTFGAEPEYPVLLKGGPKPETQDEFGLAGSTYTCEDVQFSEELTGPTTEIVLTPQYSECEGEVDAQFETNGCKYIFHTPSASTPANAELACPPGEAIVITEEAFGVNKCTVTIQSQDFGGTVTMTNKDFGATFEIDADLELDYHQQEGSGFGRCQVGTGYEDGGTYTTTIWLHGYLL